eukprot:4733414-Pleurochrysis_carterae.AAC.1
MPLPYKTIWVDGEESIKDGEQVKAPDYCELASGLSHGEWPRGASWNVSTMMCATSSPTQSCARTCYVPLGKPSSTYGAKKH